MLCNSLQVGRACVRVRSAARHGHADVRGAGRRVVLPHPHGVPPHAAAAPGAEQEPQV
eukprot:jgi/Mesen1/2314/ME000155S01407